MVKKNIIEEQGLAIRKEWYIKSSDSNSLELIQNYFSRASDKKIPIANLTKSEIETVKNQHFVSGIYKYQNLFRKQSDLGKFLGFKNTNGFFGKIFSYYDSEIVGSEEQIYASLSRLNICKTRDECSELVSLMNCSKVQCHEYSHEFSATTTFKLENVLGPNREKNIKLMREFDMHING